jgi:NO-binding membrane sensor protein with MHYT domain
MLNLLGTNIIGILLFGGLYAAAALRYIPSWVFPPVLIAALAGFVAFWIRIERVSGPAGGLLSRLGRILAALLLTVPAAAAFLLMPLFALRSRLPPAAGFDDLPSRAMVLLLIALTLTVLSNLCGILLAVLRPRIVPGAPKL